MQSHSSTHQPANPVSDWSAVWIKSTHRWQISGSIAPSDDITSQAESSPDWKQNYPQCFRWKVVVLLREENRNLKKRNKNSCFSSIFILTVIHLWLYVIDNYNRLYNMIIYNYNRLNNMIIDNYNRLYNMIIDNYNW